MRLVVINHQHPNCGFPRQRAPRLLSSFKCRNTCIPA
jgi:hypothetical protein